HQTTDRVNDTTDQPTQVRNTRQTRNHATEVRQTRKTRESRNRGVTTGKTRQLTQTRNQAADRVNDTTDQPTQVRNTR
ncbi:hypothetical protein ACTJJ4_16580, partial [Microbacterium sp. 22195]|uniref:hypothetical protein n=1 Tax=Microbacterium sp. 22195 TaxID=3453891 RepID=UPI003F865A8D